MGGGVVTGWAERLSHSLCSRVAGFLSFVFVRRGLRELEMGIVGVVEVSLFVEY